MNYVSTRGRAPELSFCDTLLGGLASDGGLYVPSEWPQTQAIGAGSYAERAAAIMQPFIGDEIPPGVFLGLCHDAYSTFRQPDIAPLVQVSP